MGGNTKLFGVHLHCMLLRNLLTDNDHYYNYFLMWKLTKYYLKIISSIQAQPPYIFTVISSY